MNISTENTDFDIPGFMCTQATESITADSVFLIEQAFKGLFYRYTSS